MQCLIVDDHPLTRDGTVLVLRTVDAAAIVHEAESLARAREVVLEHPGIDLVLLDLDLPDSRGIATLQHLRQWLEDQSIDARIVVLSGLGDPALVRDVVNEWGTGFILKASSRSIFESAVRLTLAGGIYIPPLALRQMTGGTDASPAAPPPLPPAQALTRREGEVAALLVRGFTYKRIARELERRDGAAISEHTVRAHVGNIAWKLGVTENAKAGVMAEIARRGLTFADS